MHKQHRDQSLTDSFITLGALSGSQLEDKLAQCVAIDQARLKQYGFLYSEEVWDCANFRAERPGKADLTQLALDGDDKVIGFWVASLRAGNIHHTHRVATRPNSGSSSLATILGINSWDSGLNMGCKTAELSVHFQNERAIAVYLAMGYQRLTGLSLKNLATELGFVKYPVVEDRVCVSETYQLWIMTRELK